MRNPLNVLNPLTYNQIACNKKYKNHSLLEEAYTTVKEHLNFIVDYLLAIAQ